MPRYTCIMHCRPCENRNVQHSDYCGFYNSHRFFGKFVVWLCNKSTESWDGA